MFQQKAAGTFKCPEEGAHVYQCDNGDIACDSYNQMDRDIQVDFQIDLQKSRSHWPLFFLDGDWLRALPCQ